MKSPDPLATALDSPRSAIETAEQHFGRPARFIRLPEVKVMTALSRATIYKRMKVQRFPQAITLSVRLTVWIDLEVQAWMAQQIASQRAGST